MCHPLSHRVRPLLFPGVAGDQSCRTTLGARFWKQENPGFSYLQRHVLSEKPWSHPCKWGNLGRHSQGFGGPILHVLGIPERNSWRAHRIWPLTPQERLAGATRECRQPWAAHSPGLKQIDASCKIAAQINTTRLWLQMWTFVVRQRVWMSICLCFVPPYKCL